MCEKITNIGFQRRVLSRDQCSFELFFCFFALSHMWRDEWWKLEPPSTGRGSPLLAPLCAPASVIAVVKWYYGSSPCSTERLSSHLFLIYPPLFFFSFLSLPPSHPHVVLLLADRGEDAPANEILERFRAGRKSSRKTRERGVFLVCLVAELKENGEAVGGARWGNRKRKKERGKGKKSEHNE